MKRKIVLSPPPVANLRKFRRVVILLLLAALVLTIPASAKYADTGDVVWSTRLDGLTYADLEALIGTPSTPGEPGECGCECTCQSCAFLKAHPVGDIWMTVSDTDPNEVYGGEWERWGQGRVPVGAGPDTPGEYNTVDDTSFRPFVYADAGVMGGSAGATSIQSILLSGLSVSGTIPVTGDVSHTTGSGSVSGTALGITLPARTGDHRLTIPQMPAHNHVFRRPRWLNSETANAGTYLALAVNSGTSSAFEGLTGFTGSGDEQANTDGLGHSHTIAAASNDHENLAHTFVAPAYTFGNGLGSSDGLTAGGEAEVELSDATMQPFVTCFMWKRMPGTGDDKCTGGPCGCGGGSGGTGGDCDCTGCDGTCETMAVPDYDSEDALIDQPPDSTTGTNTRTWEAPYTGFVSVYTAVGNTSNAVAMSIYINDIRVSYRQNSSSSVNQYWYFQEPPIPVKEHDTIEVRITQGSFHNASTASFFPPVFIGAGCCANSGGTPGSGGTPADLSGYVKADELESIHDLATRTWVSDNYLTPTDISGTGPITYNSATGVIGLNTTTSIRAAGTATDAAVATEKAVRAAIDGTIAVNGLNSNVGDADVLERFRTLLTKITNRVDGMYIGNVAVSFTLTGGDTYSYVFTNFFSEGNGTQLSAMGTGSVIQNGTGLVLCVDQIVMVIDGETFVRRFPAQNYASASFSGTTLGFCAIKGWYSSVRYDYPAALPVTP